MDNPLISNGYKTIETLIDSLPGEPVFSAYIDFFDGNRETGEDFDKEVKALFSYASHLDKVMAARISWRQLLLFSTDSVKLEDLFLPKLRMTDNSGISSRAIFEATIGPTENRHFRIANMAMQLSKLQYWSKHIYPGYYLNGEYKQLT